MELSGNVNNLSDQGAIAYLREQEAIRKARATRRWITFGIVLASMFVLMVGCGIAVGAASSGGGSSSASARPVAPAPALVAPSTPDLSAEAIEPSTATTAPETVTPGASDSSLSGIYGPGTYVVGRDITPGDYWTAGSATGDSGYAERLSGTTGDHDEGIGIVSVPEHGPAQITILGTDHAVEFYGTGIVWTKVS